MAVVILSIGLLVFLSHLLTGVFQRTRVPDVLVLMLAGIVIGPALHLVRPDDFGKVGPVFTTLALIVILFEGGIHLSIRELGSAARDTLFISLASFVFTVLALAYLADAFLPVEPLTALLIGTILGGTSSAVVVPMIRILRMSRLPGTVLMLESALTDVLAVVLSLGLMRALEPGADASLTAPALALTITQAFLIAALIGVAGAFVWSAILPRVREIPNTVFTTIAYVLILFGVTEWLGYSGAIAALTFGIGVANLPLIPERLLGRIISFRLVGFAEVERTVFAETVFLVKTFFFVYLGISITFGDWPSVLAGVTLVLTAFAGRLVMVRLLAPRSFTRRDAMLTTALIPKGLAAAVLASLPLQRGLPDGVVIQDTVYAVIFFSIVGSATLVFLIEAGLLDRVAARLFAPFAPAPASAGADERPVAPFQHSIGLPAIVKDVEEPNLVRFDGEKRPTRSADPPSGAPPDPPASPPPTEPMAPPDTPTHPDPADPERP